jgi:hypothetical protein
MGAGVVTGYLSPLYARSLRGIGEPFELPACEGWLLRRQLQAGRADAIGCYPLFLCRSWTSFEADIQALEGRLVSVSLVPDPFGAADTRMLQRMFPDVCRPFKEHFTVDLRDPRVPPPHHRRNLQAARRFVSVERCSAPPAHAAEWVRLYEGLIQRHRITGPAALSADALGEQLHVPGLIMLRAMHRGVCVGMTLWYERDDVAYYHLGAYSESGYATRASYALFDAAFELLRERVRWVDLGGGAGTGNGSNGLARFKEGWANGRRFAYFCGRIFDADEYGRLSAVRPRGSGLFPAYLVAESA